MGGKQGARDGPTEFRKAFYKLPNYFEKKEGLLIDLGNIKIDLDSDLPSIHQRMIEIIPILIKHDIFPIVIGGGNDVTYSGVRGLRESGQFQKLGMISFDAHLNLHEVPEKFISASSMKRIMSEFPDLIKSGNIVYFGSRKETISPHYARYVLDNNMHIFYKDKINVLQRELLQGLNQANFECDGIIISFDMDCCDAGMFPGTSFPMPGGFNSDEIIEIAKSLSKFKMGAYLDIINLNPEQDRNDITSGMAALFLFHYLEKK
jgi:arginase family enzyme